MKRVSFAPKPVGPLGGQTPDQWVNNQLPSPLEPTKRLTIDVPLGLHKRMKTQCAIEELVMADVMRELLSKRFPEPPEDPGEGGEGGERGIGGGDGS